MTLARLIQRLWRRMEVNFRPVSYLRILVWRLRGARIGRGTWLPSTHVTWPHQVSLGRNCVLQPGIFFNYDHFWTPGPSILIGDRVFIGKDAEFNIQGILEIGDDCLIAAGCTLVDHDHAMAAGTAMNAQPSVVANITIGRNVWLGAKCIVLKGISIGDNAVIGAGSIVTKSIPANEVWMGNPARRHRAL